MMVPAHLDIRHALTSALPQDAADTQHAILTAIPTTAIRKGSAMTSAGAQTHAPLVLMWIGAPAIPMVQLAAPLSPADLNAIPTCAIRCLQEVNATTHVIPHARPMHAILQTRTLGATARAIPNAIRTTAIPSAPDTTGAIGHVQTTTQNTAVRGVTAGMAVRLAILSTVT